MCTRGSPVYSYVHQRTILGLARIDLAEKRYAEALNKAEKALALDANNREAQSLISAMPR